MNANERRLRKLEQAMPKTVHGFTATLREQDPPLAVDDSRLRHGIEEFVFTFAEGTINPGGKEKRGRGYVNPWTVADFWGGGKRAAWNKALALLRADPDFDDTKTGRVVHGAIDFTEQGGEVRRVGGLTFTGWSHAWWDKYKSAYEVTPINPERAEEYGSAILQRPSPARVIHDAAPRGTFQDRRRPDADETSKRRLRLQNLGIDLDD